MQLLKYRLFLTAFVCMWSTVVFSAREPFGIEQYAGRNVVMYVQKIGDCQQFSVTKILDNRTAQITWHGEFRFTTEEGICSNKLTPEQTRAKFIELENRFKFPEIDKRYRLMLQKTPRCP